MSGSPICHVGLPSPHKAKELLSRACVLTDAAEETASAERGISHIYTAQCHAAMLGLHYDDDALRLKNVMVLFLG